MHSQHHIHSPHIKELSHRLQHEVDTILKFTNDKAIHAEFRETEIVEIENGVHHDIVRESIDARIDVNMGRNNKQTPVAENKTHTHPIHVHPAHKIEKKTKRVLDIFFKPFHI